MDTPFSRLLLSLFTLASAFVSSRCVAETPSLADIAYREAPSTSEYERTRCLLDVYLPARGKDFATLVWFHGGGLTSGSKDGEDTVRIAASLAGEGVAVVVPNYRLSPGAAFPAYIEDAAAAVAWTVRHIAEHGGDARRVFVGGHSAGGYLTFMLGMDARYLKAHGLELSCLAGLIPVSGQTMTHATVRGERGLGRFSVTADEAAPVRYAAEKGLPPMLIVWADNDMPARGEENAYLVALLKGAKQPHVTGVRIADRDHGSVGSRIAEENDAARALILKFIAHPKAEP